MVIRGLVGYVGSSDTGVRNLMMPSSINCTGTKVCNIFRSGLGLSYLTRRLFASGRGPFVHLIRLNLFEVACHRIFLRRL